MPPTTSSSSSTFLSSQSIEGNNSELDQIINKLTEIKTKEASLVLEEENWRGLRKIWKKNRQQIEKKKQKLIL